jgi:hypothetical protein
VMTSMARERGADIDPRAVDAAICARVAGW